MAVQRIKLACGKKTSVQKNEKREVAEMLRVDKEEKARIRVEKIIREDFLLEAYEIIELLCELIHERARYMSSQKECPADLEEAVISLIWVSSRVDIEELAEVRRQLGKKFGSKFTEAATTNIYGKVNERLAMKLRLEPPTARLINRYLEEIAKEYNVNWAPSDLGISDLNAPVPAPAGFSVPMAPGSELRSAYQRQTDAAPTAPDASAVKPPPPAGSDPSFEDLAARFDALKNNK